MSNYVEEKKRKSCNGDVDVVATEAEEYIMRSDIHQAVERRLVRKLDFRLLPTIVIIFIMNYIDTSSTTQSLRSYMYLIAQHRSHLIWSVFMGWPTFYIGTCVVLWGLTSALTRVTHNFAGIVACRVFIGLPEFIAAGILGNMQGKLGIAAWRWLFYIEGYITTFVGFQAMWLLPDYLDVNVAFEPNNTRWLTPAERRLAQARLAEDAGEADQDSAEASYAFFSTTHRTVFEGFKMAIKDPKLLGLSFVKFFPTIRWMLVRENKRMEREEMDLMHGPERQRIEEAAKLEGITFEKAIKRRKGFRYLY
ncbi:hypothetical protein EDB19DRAFT_1967289 [Suillus lakei]|nr:hypothetical protein EDB19DRAFT_1967289 [Suillus lakei]